MEKNLIKKEVERIRKRIIQKYKPEKILIFGSYVWGRFTRDSDVDFFIIKNSKKRKLDRMRQVRKLVGDRNISIDILVYTPKEVEERLNLGDFFIEDIIKKGKLIYERK